MIPPNPPRIRWRNASGLFLLLLGLTAMIGDLLGLQPLKGIGIVSCAAPAPKVFSDIQGLEGFACDFTLEMVNASGSTNHLPITPELYARLKGPYNRRNVYGAALSYGPRLPRDLWEPIFRYGLSKDGPLRTELKLPSNATQIRVLIHTRTQGRSDRWILEPSWTE